MSRATTAVRPAPDPRGGTGRASPQPNRRPEPRRQGDAMETEAGGGLAQTALSDREAWRWVNGGLVLVLAGSAVLRLDDPFLLTVWGLALLLIGGVATLVGT